MRAEGHNRIAEISVPATVFHLAIAKHSTSVRVICFTGGAMQVFKLGFVAAVMVCALSATAQAADCTRVAAIGDNFTHDLAVLFSTNALKNTIAGRGLIGKGPVKTSCKSGSAMIECYSSQMACKGGTPATCLGPWLCF